MRSYPELLDDFNKIENNTNQDYTSMSDWYESLTPEERSTWDNYGADDEAAKLLADAYASCATSEQMTALLASIRQCAPETFASAASVEAFIVRVEDHLKSRQRS